MAPFHFSQIWREKDEVMGKKKYLKSKEIYYVLESQLNRESESEKKILQHYESALETINDHLMIWTLYS